MERLTTWVPQNTSYTPGVLPGLEQREKAFAVLRAGLVQTHEAPKHNAFHFFSSSPSLSQSRNLATYPMESHNSAGSRSAEDNKCILN